MQAHMTQNYPTPLSQLPSDRRESPRKSGHISGIITLMAIRTVLSYYIKPRETCEQKRSFGGKC